MVSAPPLSLATTEGILFVSFPLGTEMFHFPRFPPYSLCVQLQVLDHYRGGFPIQKSPDQRLFAASPKLIAGYHVFHRLLLPSHPPYALTYFDHPVPDLSISDTGMAKIAISFVLYTRHELCLAHITY